jgi:hypothetical protein
MMLDQLLFSNASEDDFVFYLSEAALETASGW